MEPRASLVNLPAETLSQIIDYLVPDVIPQDKTFRIRRPPRSKPPPPRPEKYVKPERYFYSWTTKEYEAWEAGESALCPQVLPLLLIHPVWYQSILARLYSNNTLWFPDPHTFSEFTRNLSPQALAAVRTLALDACGEILSFHGCTSTVYSFEYPAPIEIADTIAKYPGLRDLTLLGVGPGLCGRAVCSDEPVSRYASGPDGRPYTITIPPGPYLTELGEDDRYWSLESIALINHIVNPILDDSGNAEGQHSGTPKCYRSQASQVPDPFQGGRVFCRKPRERSQAELDGHKDSGGRVIGRARHMGTRIVRHNADVEVGDLETELIDVAAALSIAVVEHEKKQEYERRKHAGMFPKPRTIRGGYN